jgi:predicted nucleic acid-binding Zn ribbon protein
MAVPKVANHAHCVSCDKAIPYGEETCSEECAAEVAEQEQKRKRMMYITYGLFGLGIVILVVLPMVQRFL